MDNLPKIITIDKIGKSDLGARILSSEDDEEISKIEDDVSS